jgi:hypothetical protein
VIGLGGRFDLVAGGLAAALDDRFQGIRDSE